MNSDSFDRLLELNPDILEQAKAVATTAVAALPANLDPAEEPAHVYEAAARKEVAGHE